MLSAIYTFLLGLLDFDDLVDVFDLVESFILSLDLDLVDLVDFPDFADFMDPFDLFIF